MRTHELFEIQGGLKAHIGYNGPDKFEKMMLAMIVEFMEAANDWRGFKYWSVNQERKDTLLEEYVDGLHFVLEAGLDLVEMNLLSELPKEVVTSDLSFDDNVTEQFKKIVSLALRLDSDASIRYSLTDMRYIRLFQHYLALGEMLGFNADQIHAAYLAKNKVNHDRQLNGY